jgi:hypothetical protein
VGSRARPNPLTFPTIDAWNLAVQRAITSTLSVTVAYVGNKGTHTLGDGDGNNTNPNEAAIFLPASYSVTGQALNYDPSGPKNPGGLLVPGYAGGVNNSNYLSRYYGGSLAACKDAGYIAIADLQSPAYDNDPNLQSGMCGWTSGITYQGNNQNTEFDALQITLAQTFSKGLAYTANYQWASAFDEQTGYYTWDHNITHGRDSNTRDQQLILYGSYDLPFGKGKQYAGGVNHATDLLIGGFQLSGVMTWAGGLPFSLNYGESASNVPGDAPNWPSAAAGAHMPTSLAGFSPGSKGTGTRKYYTAQTTNLLSDPGTGIFVNPGLDHIGNTGLNTYRGPKFFSTDLAVAKAFSVWESVAVKFRMDAFNAFNHINPGNPGGGIESDGSITSEANGCFPNGSCGPRQLEFSLRVQF